MPVPLRILRRDDGQSVGVVGLAPAGRLPLPRMNSALAQSEGSQEFNFDAEGVDSARIPGSEDDLARMGGAAGQGGGSSFSLDSAIVEEVAIDKRRGSS